METPRLTRVLLVDDNDLFREGLGSLLGRYADLSIVGQLPSGEAALQQAVALAPDVILIDCAMPGMGGVEATRRLAALLPAAAIAMLTVSESDADLFQSVEAGARGYLVKSMDLRALHAAIGTLAAGGSVVTPPLATRLLEEFTLRLPAKPRGPGALASLTEREREVLALLAQGWTTVEMAEQLGIAANTVKVHLRNILDKLHLLNRQHAAAFAVQEGLTQPSSDRPAPPPRKHLRR